MCDFYDFEDDFEDDGLTEEPIDNGPIGESDKAPMTDISDGLDWEDVAFLGALSESLAEERRRREQIEREHFEGKEEE